MLAALPLLIMLAQSAETIALKPIEVDTAAAHRLGRVRSCYVAAHRRAPGLFGVIAVGMSVAPDGKVGDRWIALSTLGRPSLERCVLDAFQGLVLPAPGEPGAQVRYGMLFTAKDTPPEPAKVQEEAWKAALR